jgi:hypothetical protein
MNTNKVIPEIREIQANCHKLSDEIDEKIAETKLMAETFEAVRKADNQIIHLRMQDALLPECAEVIQ